MLGTKKIKWYHSFMKSLKCTFKDKYKTITNLNKLYNFFTFSIMSISIYYGIFVYI